MAGKSALNDVPQATARAGDPLAGDPVDRGYLARFTLGNSALEREVLQLFAGQLPLYLRALNQACTRKAWKDAAHTIKGSAAAVGAWRLARFAEMAEKVDVESELAQAEGHRTDIVAALSAAADETCRFIERLLADA